MAGRTPPGGGAASYGANGATAAVTPPRFTLSEEEEGLDLHHASETAALRSPASPSQRPQAVFNLELDYSDDDALLDYEQYSGLRRPRCCGVDCGALGRLAPCLPAGPPDWWFSYTRKQRRIILGAAAALGVLTIVLLGFAIGAFLDHQRAPTAAAAKPPSARGR